MHDNVLAGGDAVTDKAHLKPRGLYETTLCDKWPTALFAAIHFYPLLLPFAFTVGLGAGWVRERTGSALNFFVAHAANNILFLAIAYVLVRWYGM